MDVSAIVQVDAIGPESVSRVSNMLMAVAKSPRDEDHPLRIDTSYDDERARFKVFVSGSTETTVTVLNMLKKFVEKEEP